MDADGTVTIDEAYHVFTHAETVQEVTEQVWDIWEEVDVDEDGNFDKTEFLAAFNVLQSVGVLSETDLAEVMKVYNHVLQ